MKKQISDVLSDELNKAEDLIELKKTKPKKVLDISALVAKAQGRFDKKKTSDWTIEGPRKINRHSVISANHYMNMVKPKELKLNEIKQITE